MKLRWLALIAAFTAATPVAQLAAQVDFARDVRPIFREHCFSCHGPDQQMNGFRLDRRADALRGGTQSDIGPGTRRGAACITV
jgi:mono/diheme cytochrome c family protein